MTTPPTGRRWAAPEPRQLPDWRARLVEHTESELGLRTLAATINAGHASLMPLLSGNRQSDGAVAAPLLSALEARRLREASLYYATGDMTALAVAAGSTAPTEPVREARLPSRSGLMLFHAPIGGYDTHLPAVLGQRADGLRDVADITVTTPIVAVSWSVWTPGDVQVTDAPGALRWVSRTPDDVIEVPRDYRGIWLTFYAPSGGAFGALPPSTVVAHYPDGTAATARHLAGEVPGPQLSWDNETVIKIGASFAREPVPDTVQEWVQVVYTAWQLIGQSTGTRPLTEIEAVARDRAGRRRDERAGLPTDGVRVVRVHSAHRPPKSAADQDEAASTGLRAPAWSCRWPVTPHRRSQCMNPRAHQDGACEHVDKIIPFHFKGPADKPLRLGRTVHLWDEQPDPSTQQNT